MGNRHLPDDQHVNRVFGAWETAGQVYFGEIDRKARASQHRFPLLATAGLASIRVSRQTRRATFAWTEGTAWARGGSLSWQVFDPSGRVTIVKDTAPGVPVWSFAAPVARADGRFVVLY